MSTGKKIAIIVMLAAALALAAAPMPGTSPLGPGVFGCYQPIPFLLGGEIAGPPMLGWNAYPWAFGSQCDVASLPLYFNAHGFGFPLTLGNFRIGLVPAAY